MHIGAFCGISLYNWTQSSQLTVFLDKTYYIMTFFIILQLSVTESTTENDGFRAVKDFRHNLTQYPQFKNKDSESQKSKVT